jgi:hypothetical protein
MLRRISVSGSLIALPSAVPIVAKAQQGTAAITGVVTDESGAVIQGATVILRNPHTGVVLKAKTASGGSCVFKLVPPRPFPIPQQQPSKR